jgi:hypothetical protein
VLLAELRDNCWVGGTEYTKGGELRRRFVECPSAYELQELGGVSGGTAAFGLCLRLIIALCSALRAARHPEPFHSQALYEPHLLAVSILLQPSGYQAGPTLLGGHTATALPSSYCGPEEQPHEGSADAHPT